MALANVALTDTFDTWRTRTNQIVIINNALTEGSHTTTGTITSTNTNAAINVTAGFIRVKNNVFSSNAISVVSNTASLSVSGDGRLGTTVYINVATLTTNVVDQSIVNIASANLVNSVYNSVLTISAAGNNYTNAVGLSGNNYTNTVGVAGNNYTNAVGVAGNNYATAMDTAGNNYTNAVGLSGNNYANLVSFSANNFAGAMANAANAFAVSVGAAGNNYSNAEATAGNNYTNAVGTAGNNYTVFVAGSANNWSNTKVSSVAASAPLSSSGGVSPTISINTGGSMQIGSLGVGTGASGTTGEIRATNNITAYYSDGRLKTIISTIPLPIEKIRQLSGIIYTNNDVAASFGYADKSEQVGVIAQEVEKVLPQIVKLAPFDSEYVDGQEVSKSGENYKTVQYEKLIPLLIEAIKELSNEVEILKNKLGN